MAVKYMLLDITARETITVLKVAPIREITEWSKLFKAEGRKVLGPPVEGRGFSKLALEDLQYLYWNLTEQPPSDNYGDLVQACLVAVEAIPEDRTPLKRLEQMVEQVQAAADAAKEPVDSTKPPRATPQSVANPANRPKAGSTTGQVWAIADELSFGGALASRKAVVELCVRKGINEATASTQYGKWKGSKLAEKKA